MTSLKWTKEFPRRAGRFFIRWPNGKQEMVDCQVIKPALMGTAANGQDFCVADGIMGVYCEGEQFAMVESSFTSAQWLGPIAPESIDHLLSENKRLREACESALKSIQFLYDADAVPSLLQYEIDSTQERLRTALKESDDK